MLNSALVGALIGGTVAVVMMIVVFLINRGKTGTEYLTKMPRRVLTFTTPASPDKVMAAFAGGMPEAKAKLMQTDDTNKRLVLASPMSLATWGFWYPMHITARADGGSDVAVGIASRGMQWGPLVTQAHKNFVAMAEAKAGAARAA